MSQRKLAKNISIMSIAVLLSRILGLIRDQVMAFFFGASYLNDAFNVAYNIPNLLRRLFGEGALSAAFVPIYNEQGIKHGQKAQLSFALNMLSLLTFALSVLTMLGIAFAPLIVKALYPGLAPETSLIAIKLSRIVFPYLFFIGLSSTMIAILNSHDLFFMTGLSSALLNIGMIASMVLPYLTWGYRGENLIIWSAWGVFVGGVLQTVVNLPYLRRLGYRFRFNLGIKSAEIKAMWSRFLPSMIGIGIREINLVADTLMASFLPIGSITALGFGNRLMQLPLGVFAISAGTAILPIYSRNIAEKKYADISQNLHFTSVSLSCVILPVTLIISVLGRDFVHILFEHGSFDSKAALMTTQALVLYSLGLIFYSLNQTITPLFYANKDTKTPVKIAAYMVSVNIILNLVLMQFLQHRGLALSTSITAVVNYLILIKLLSHKIPEISFGDTFINIGKAALICFVLYLPFSYVNSLFSFSTKLAIIGKDILLSIAVFIIFFFFASLLRIPYLDKVRSQLWSRLVHR